MLIWSENNRKIDRQLLITKLESNSSKISCLLQDNYLILITNKKCNINGFNIKRLAQ